MNTNRVYEAIQEARKKPSFFKILFVEAYKPPESMATKREIPPEFLKNVLEDFQDRVTLKVAWGNSWQISLYKNRTGIFMEESGWEKFLKDNSLGDEEFLVFTHEGNTCMSVKIFKKNALQVLEPPKPVHPRPGKYQTHTVTGNASIFRDVKPEPKSETSDSVEFFSEREPKQRTDLRRKKARKLEIHQKTTAKSSASFGFPHFTIEIKKSYLHFLAIPRSFASRHLPMETTELKICDPQGRKWKVTYICRESGQTFSKGWRQLTKMNDLQIGDQCTFELVQPTELRMKVSKRN